MFTHFRIDTVYVFTHTIFMTQIEQTTQQHNTPDDMTDVTVREMPKRVWQQARAAALLADQPIGQWVAEAIRQRLAIRS